MATINGNICSQPGKQLFPAWENIVPWAGRKKENKGRSLWSFGHLVKIKKTLSKSALYINYYLYIVSNDRISKSILTK